MNEILKKGGEKDMNKPENQTTLEDLPVEETRQDEVKGGPIYMKYPPMELKGE